MFAQARVDYLHPAGFKTLDNEIETEDHNQIELKQQRDYLVNVFSVNNNYLLGLRVSNIINSCTSSAILLQSNGRPVIFPVLILKAVIFELNQLIQPEFYCYYNPKHQLVFNLKQIMHKLSKTEYEEYLNHKFMRLTQIISIPFCLLGVDDRVRYGDFGEGLKIGQYQVQAIKEGLKAKKEVVQIVRKFCNIKPPISKKEATQKLQKKQIVQMIQSQPQQQQTQIYKYYRRQKKRNKIGQINRSQKYEISQNMVTLVDIQICNKQNEVVQIQSQVECELVEKCVKIAYPKLEERAYHKLHREIDIIKQIKFGSEYFPSYYFHKKTDEEEQQDKVSFFNIALFVESFPNDLAFWIANEFLDAKTVAERFSELAKGVKMMHKSGVVHRDLKPENIMISQSQFETRSRIKIIDFSDSASVNEPYTKKLSNSLGSSLPYSPFQCLFNCSFGTNSPTIDIWSLGILVFEMFYGKLPSLYYFNTTREQAANGIGRNQFSLALTPKYRRRRMGYFTIVEQIVHLLVHFCVVLVHTDRLDIQKIIKITEVWKNLTNETNAILQEYRDAYLSKY